LHSAPLNLRAFLPAPSASRTFGRLRHPSSRQRRMTKARNNWPSIGIYIQVLSGTPIWYCTPAVRSLVSAGNSMDSVAQSTPTHAQLPATTTVPFTSGEVRAADLAARIPATCESRNATTRAGSLQSQSAPWSSREARGCHAPPVSHRRSARTLAR
jgi:hypothetical protein